MTHLDTDLTPEFSFSVSTCDPSVEIQLLPSSLPAANMPWCNLNSHGIQWLIQWLIRANPRDLLLDLTWNPWRQKLWITFNAWVWSLALSHDVYIYVKHDMSAMSNVSEGVCLWLSMLMLPYMLSFVYRNRSCLPYIFSLFAYSFSFIIHHIHFFCHLHFLPISLQTLGTAAFASQGLPKSNFHNKR